MTAKKTAANDLPGVRERAVQLLHRAPQALAGAGGISLEGVARVLDYADHPEFDAVDRLVLEYSIAAREHFHRTPDALFRSLRERFPEA